MGNFAHALARLVATPMVAVTLLAASAAHAQTCPEGEGCAIDVHAGTCTVLASGDVGCLVDPVQACVNLAFGASCPVLAEDDGTCRIVDEVMTCVPNATDAACDGRRVDDTCARGDGLAATCRPDRGLLGCVPSAPCALAAVDVPCVDDDGVGGFCRDVGDDALVCTTVCTAVGSPCLAEGGFDGVCEAPVGGGALRCRDPNVICSEGETCLTGNGEEGRCVRSGGEGGLDCQTEEEIEAAREASSGGCCLQDRNPSMSALRQEALGALGIGIAAVVARRRRRPGRAKAGEISG